MYLGAPCVYYQSIWLQNHPLPNKFLLVSICAFTGAMCAATVSIHVVQNVW